MKFKVGDIIKFTTTRYKDYTNVVCRIERISEYNTCDIRYLKHHNLKYINLIDTFSMETMIKSLNAIKVPINNKDHYPDWF